MPPVGERLTIAAALPGTIHEIIGRNGLSQATARRWLAVLRDAGQAHICGWKATGGGHTPRYAAGPGPDAKKPPRKSGAAYSRKHRKILRIERQEFQAARARAIENANRAEQSTQHWASALMGST